MVTGAKTRPPTKEQLEQDLRRSGSLNGAVSSALRLNAAVVTTFVEILITHWKYNCRLQRITAAAETVQSKVF